MKKIIFLTALMVPFIFGITAVHSQVYTGGNLGFHYDNKGYYIDVAPVIGYRYARLNLGLSPFYSYSEYKDKDNQYSYGGRIYSQLTIYRNVFAHAEFEARNIEKSEDRKWIVGLPVGGGYRYKIGPNAQAYGAVLYDVLLDDDSPAENPIIRGGITYNF